jgi:biotin transport system permease protein
MRPAGTFRPGTSVLHRAGAGTKLAALTVLTTVVVVVRSPAAVAAAAVVVLALYGLARWSPRVALEQVRPLWWLVLLLVPFQLLTAGWRAAVVVVGTLVVAVAAACLVTLTTRVSDLLDTLVALLRPLRAVGVDPERAGLALALAVRAVPVVGALAHEVRDARRARGLGRSVRALAVPLVVRSVRHAQRTGEALAARGVDD